MDRILKSGWFHIGVIFVIFVGVFIAYSNTFSSSFHFDDVPHIVSNYQIRDLDNTYALLKGNRGVTMVTFAVNYAIGELDTTSYHVFNTLIHIATAILAYFVLFFTLRMVSKDGGWSKKIAAFAALLFALHPVQTQSVTYIVQRMESLSSLFYLIALLVFLKAAAASTHVKRIILYAGVVVVYILGFHSKEVIITLPAIVLLYDFYFLKDRAADDPDGNERHEGAKPGTGLLTPALKSRLPLYGVLFILCLYFIISTVAPLGGFGDLSKESSGELVAAATTHLGAPTAGFGVRGISPLEYLYTQFNVLVYYIVLLIVPANQNLDYDFPISKGLFETPVLNQGTVLNYPLPPPIVSLIILLCILGLGVYLFLKSRRTGSKRALVASFSIFWFFIILSPTSSFVPIVDVIFEHRLYLASLGAFTVFALLIDWFFERIGGGGKQSEGSA